MKFVERKWKNTKNEISAWTKVSFDFLSVVCLKHWKNDFYCGCFYSLETFSLNPTLFKPPASHQFVSLSELKKSSLLCDEKKKCFSCFFSCSHLLHIIQRKILHHRRLVAPQKRSHHKSHRWKVFHHFKQWAMSSQKAKISTFLPAAASQQKFKRKNKTCLIIFNNLSHLKLLNHQMLLWGRTFMFTWSGKL